MNRARLSRGSIRLYVNRATLATDMCGGVFGGYSKKPNQPQGEPAGFTKHAGVPPKLLVLQR